MSELEEYEFEIAVFIYGKHVITYRGTAKDEFGAMSRSYLLTANIVDIISETIATMLNPGITDEELTIYCSRRVLKCCELLRKAGWFIIDPIVCRHLTEERAEGDLCIDIQGPFSAGGERHRVVFTVNGNEVPADGQWYHIAFTGNANEVDEFSIDEVVMYNTALSEDEVREAYSSICGRADRE